MVHSLMAVQLVGDSVEASVNLGIDGTNIAADLLHVADQLVKAFSVGARVLVVLVAVLGAQLHDLHNECGDSAEHKADAGEDCDPFGSAPAGAIRDSRGGLGEHERYFLESLIEGTRPKLPSTPGATSPIIGMPDCTAEA